MRSVRDEGHAAAEFLAFFLPIGAADFLLMAVHVREAELGVQANTRRLLERIGPAH